MLYYRIVQCTILSLHLQGGAPEEPGGGRPGRRGATGEEDHVILLVYDMLTGHSMISVHTTISYTISCSY